MAMNGITSMRKPVDALVQPEAHQVEDLGADLRVLPVQVGLPRGEDVQVVLRRSRSSRSQAEPEKNERQLLGGPPSRPARQM